MRFEILGIGIAVVFAIIALSAIILYLSFRIKSTFENDKSVKVQIAKTLLIVGVLFLAGGMFYYFAQAMSNGKQADDAMVKNQSMSKDGLAMLTVSYTEKVNTGDDYAIAFAIKSLSTKVIHNATIRVGGVSLLGAKTNYSIFGDTLIIGDILPGETDGKLTLKAPTYATGLEGALMLLSPDIDSVSTSFRISVIDTGRPLATVTPTPTVNKTPHFDGILPSQNGPASSRNPAQAANPTPTANQTATPIPCYDKACSNRTATPTPTATANQTATPTPTATANQTATPTPTATANQTATPTPTPTPAPTEAPTPTPAPTEAPTPTPAPTEAPTPTPAPTEAPTPTPAPTEAPTPTPAPTTPPS